MKFKYEWQSEYVPEKPIYIGEAVYDSEEALNAHLSNIGGKLIRILDSSASVSENPHNMLIAYAAMKAAEDKKAAEEAVLAIKIAEEKKAATVNKVATVATIAATFVAANYVADKLLKWAGVGDGSI